MKSLRYIFIIILTLAIYRLDLNSQVVNKDFSKMTREEVLELTYDELLEMPLEDLMQLADIAGVSLDELYELILNKDVTSASKREESSFDAPLSTSVISYDDIIESGATTIEEALRLIPGLIVREKTNGNYDVHIRGNDNVPPGNMLLYSENSMSLVMIDNRVVYNYAHGGAFWETLPIGIEDIDRIEVIRGPASALYGPNAVTGVIHIITKKFDYEKKHLNINAQLGTQRTKIVSLNTGLRAGEKFNINLSGNYQYRDRFQEDFYLWERQIYVPADSLTTMAIPSSLPNARPYEERPLDVRFPDPLLGRENYCVNLALFYNMNERVQFDFSSGYQNSNSITTPLDNPYYSLTRRTSETKYINFKTKAYGFNAQLSYLFGPQDVAVDVLGMQYELRTLDATLEYDYKWKNLGIRPGISYRQANYNDEEYVDISMNEGFLNGDRKLSTFSYGLRLEYNVLDKLRLIGALRADKYNYPAKTYLTYQAIASYNINDKNMIRGVYSRANRSPFMVDVYANFDWYRVTLEQNPSLTPYLPTGGHFYFEGNKDLKLATMDMIELGYRVKPVKQVQVDFEAFYNRTTNFDWFQLDTLNALIFMPISLLDYSPVGPPVQDPIPYNAVFTYRNLDLVAKQFGASISLMTVVNENLYFKVFGTIQQTRLENYKPLTVNESIYEMINEAAMNNRLIAPPEIVPGTVDDTITMTGLAALKFGGSYQPDSTISITHKATPQFYGGLMINYRILNRVNINLNLYGYGKQYLSHSFETGAVEPKLISNLKISYNIWKKSSIYFNARNLLNNRNREFAFVDDIGGLYLFGLEIKL